jgi:hypothetical protein
MKLSAWNSPICRSLRPPPPEPAARGARNGGELAAGTTRQHSPLTAKIDARCYVDFDAFIGEVGAKTDAIWMEEPQDVKRLRLGVARSGAGTNGQLFNTLLFVQSEVRGLTINACQAILVCAANDDFALSHLKAEARAHLSGRAGLLHYLGLHELGELFLRFLAHLDELTTKDDFIRVLRVLKTYGARVHMWTLHSFPWHLGLSMTRRSEAEVMAMGSELADATWTPLRYTGR